MPAPATTLLGRSCTRSKGESMRDEREHRVEKERETSLSEGMSDHWDHVHSNSPAPAT